MVQCVPLICFQSGMRSACVIVYPDEIIRQAHSNENHISHALCVSFINNYNNRVFAAKITWNSYCFLFCLTIFLQLLSAAMTKVSTVKSAGKL